MSLKKMLFAYFSSEMLCLSELRNALTLLERLAKLILHIVEFVKNLCYMHPTVDNFTDLPRAIKSTVIPGRVVGYMGKWQACLR